MKSVKTPWGQMMSAGLVAGVITTLGLLPQARGELVYEPEVSPAAPAAVRADDREQMRTALQASEKAQTSVQAAQSQPAQVVTTQVTTQQLQPQLQQAAPQQQRQIQQQVVTAPIQQVKPVQYAQAAQVQPVQYAAPVQQVQPAQYQAPIPTAQEAAAPAPAVVSTANVGATGGVSAADAPQTDVQSLSKAELMRRERTRTEVKNEDLLQERLEELRLRDEKKRTDALLGPGQGPDANGVQTVQSVAPISGITQSAVVSPVTDHPGQVGQAPVVDSVTTTTAYAVSPSPYTPSAQAQMSQGQSVTSAGTLPSERRDDGTGKVSINTHAGISSMNVDSGFQVNGKGSLGVGLDFQASENVVFQVGYTYNEYGIDIGSYGSAFPGLGSSDTYTLKQNVFDVGVKLYVNGADNRVRPFLVAGGAYQKGSLNYPDAVLNSINAISPGYGNQMPDYDSSGYLGYVGGGVDFAVSKSVSVGVSFKYYKVLSENENSQIGYGYGGNGYGAGYYGGGRGMGYNSYNQGNNVAQSLTGSYLSESNFYTLSAGASFSF